jgi:SPP1 gp7 family putative phage head morphogenesis protein
MRVKTPEKEQLSLLYHSTKTFTDTIRDMAKAQVMGNQEEERKALFRLQELIGESMVLANLMGRRRMWLMAKGAANRNEPRNGQVVFAAEDLETPVVPHVPFDEAIDDLLGRQAKVVSDEALALRQGYVEVQKMYQEGKAFALARHSSIEVTKNIQKKIISFQKQGMTIDDGSKIIAAMGDWARGYGEVVYRTNLNTSYNSGIRQMALSDPAVQEVVGAFVYQAVGDASTRPGHKWASGLIAGIHDPIWKLWTPPLGYNCRCTIRMMDRFELKRKGLLEPNGMVKVHTPVNWSKAKPDPGFPGYVA